MGAAATSGGLLITFLLLFLAVMLGLIAYVRFKQTTFWYESSLATLYNNVLRLVIIIVIGGIIAITIALPRWTRSSPSFSDSFIGQSMFDTCHCSDPATFCNDDASFRAVQAFSVLNLLVLATLAIVSAVGSNMLHDETEEENAQSPATIRTSTSPGAPPPGPRPKRVGTGEDRDEEDDAAGPAGAGTPGSALPSLICLILLIISFFFSFFSWIIFATRSLNDKCADSPLDSHNLGTTELGWGWVFRLFEWFFVTIITVLYFLTSRKFVAAFDFSMSRVHVVSLILFCMSCLSTTTATWSTEAQHILTTWTETVNGSLVTRSSLGKYDTSVSAFFACRCTDGVTPRCDGNNSAQAASIFFYIVFVFFFTIRAFFVLGQSRVWKDAFGKTLCGSLEEKDQTNFRHKKYHLFLAVCGLAPAILFFLSIIIMAGDMASESCGLTDQTADVGLVFSTIAVFLCFIEGFVCFLNNMFLKEGFIDPPPEEEKDDEDGEEDDGEKKNKKTPKKKKAKKVEDEDDEDEGNRNDNANFSGIAPPIFTNNNNQDNNTPSNSTPRNNTKFRSNSNPPQFNNPYVASSSSARMSPADADHRQQQQQQQPTPQNISHLSNINNNRSSGGNNNNNHRKNPNQSTIPPPPSNRPRNSTSSAGSTPQKNPNNNNNNSGRHSNYPPPPPPGPPPISHAVAVVEGSDDDDGGVTNSE